jgi:hypothetical protein
MTSMNYLVFLDASAGELEKILSGVKSMLVKESGPVQAAEKFVRPGDNLYFLRNNNDRTVRVKAVVIRVLPFDQHLKEDLSRVLKEMQTRLQLTEEQYSHWSSRKQAVFVEFNAAQKIPGFPIAASKIANRTSWIGFEEIHEIEEKGVQDETNSNFTG